MRIVAGEYRGRTIEAPRGETTRPTTDRVREALMSSLFSLRGGFDGAVVLDAFAGTGALGLEALSRGARSATFYENEPQAQRMLVRNVEACCKGSDKAAIVRKDFLKMPPTKTAQPFDLVFLDPPYAYDPQVVLEAIADMVATGTASPDAIVVYEHSHKDAQKVASAFAQTAMELISQKKYGKT
ncbi:MAG: 16S rRNA (guanine(966)-N(2))-methyltransferase RsmD [Eggerthellaceae bacterium]|nr:16S rRNA (guanine(966)-N(2))-methyltransferase RsmD [Eggerthellaceae bacterium]